jgi:hypothetical protein
MKEKIMTDFIERLRESKESCDRSYYQEGFSAGSRWAGKEAKFYQLKRLVDQFEHLPLLEAEWLFDPIESRFSGSQLIHAVIAGDYEPDFQASDSFWEGILGKDCPKAHVPEFLRGFTKGALCVWNEV